MSQNFLSADREQSFLLPPDPREWLPEEHLAWFVIDAVGVMDLSGFYGAYRADGHGRAAYEPSVLVALLLYCWSRGVRSSRRIERACVEDVACRVIAVDGTKVAASANRDRTMDYEQIAREIVEQQIATDRAETAEHGERRGDELPEEIKTGEGRRKYLAAARQRLERERAERAAPVPRSRARRLVDAKARLEEELAVEQRANAEYEAYRQR